MTRAMIGLATAFATFAAAFILHIVGGATDQGWLFAVAVVLIFATATGFPVLALAVSRARPGSVAGRTCLVLGGLIGAALTASALWAANGRAFAWWEAPAGLALVLAVSGPAFFALRRFHHGTNSSAEGPSHGRSALSWSAAFRSILPGSK